MEGVHRGGSTFSFTLLIPWIVRYRVFVFAYPFLSLVRKVQGLGPLTFFVCCIFFFLVLGWSIFFVAADRLLLLGITYFFPSRPHIINMGVSLLQTVFLLASASQAFASCAHGTFLSPRAEDGSVKVNTFGYSGEIVSPLET